MRTSEPRIRTTVGMVCGRNNRGRARGRPSQNAIVIGPRPVCSERFTMREHVVLSVVSGQYSQALQIPRLVIPLLVVGVLFNLLALCVLSRTWSRTNKRYVFLLCCQFAQDSLWLSCHLILYVMLLLWPDAFAVQFACKYRLVLVFCNLSTCSVIFLMAVERWMALTKPFFYHIVRITVVSSKR